jgi:catechol 2,3-dioxygenase
MDAIIRTLLAIQSLAVDIPEVKELDINPLWANEQGVLALDARIGIRPEERPGSTRFAIRPYPAELSRHITDREGRSYFKAWDEHDHHSLVLREADSAGLDYFAFKVYDDAALVSLTARIEAAGVAVTHLPAGHYPHSGRRIQYTLPGGHVMQLYAEKDYVGNTMPRRNPGTLPDDGVIKGMRATRLDHVLLAGPHLPEVAKFFTEVLDFDIGEELIDNDSGMQLAIFMCCSNKPHDIAFVLRERST